MFYCPQCEGDTEQLHEGYCQSCRDENQNNLDRHNFEFDYWETLTDKERDNKIKQAIV